MTLLDLLVVVTLVSTFLPLLLPAILNARERANATQCRTHLRTIGEAAQLHVDQHGIYPMGGPNVPHPSLVWARWPKPPDAFQTGVPASAPEQDWGWAYQLLPFLQRENQWQSDPNKLIHVPVPVYFCPSRAGVRFLGLQAAIDYAGNGGHLTFVDPGNGKPLRGGAHEFPYSAHTDPHSGTIGMNVRFVPGPRANAPVVDAPLKPADITDGTSTTLLFAEKRVNSALLGKLQPGDDHAFISAFCTNTIRTGGVSPGPDETDPKRPVYDGFGSAHPSGFHAVFADGSVHVISYAKADQQVQRLTAGRLTLLQRLCHRNDGGTVEID